METLISTVNIVIAILAFIITLIQFYDFAKRNSESRKKARCVKQLENLSTLSEKLIHDYEDRKENSGYIHYMKALDKISGYYNGEITFPQMRTILWGKTYSKRSDGENYFELVDLYIKATEQIANSIVENSNIIVETLLLCESEFSLSYGFGRYIDAFRAVVYGESFEEYQKATDLLKNYIKSVPLDRKDYLAKVAMVKGDLKKCNLLFNNQFLEDAALTDYKTVFFPWLMSAKRLEEEIAFLVPYLKEMRAKFSQKSIK